MTRKISNNFRGKSQIDHKQEQARASVQLNLHNLVISKGKPCKLQVLSPVFP